MITDLDTRLQWDDIFHDFTVFDKVNENEDFAYWWFRAPIMVSNRDFVVRRRYTENVGGYDFLIVVNSEQHTAKPKHKKYVRADMINSVTIFKKIDENTCEMIMLSQVNLNVKCI